MVEAVSFLVALLLFLAFVWAGRRLLRVPAVKRYGYPVERGEDDA